MKRLLPADKKALAMAAWLFYAERGFDAQLLHRQDAEEIEINVTYEGHSGTPHVSTAAASSYGVVRIGYSDKVYRCTIPEVFI